MEQEYWQQLANRRLARRGLLRSAGALSAGIAAAALAGCGSKKTGNGSAGGQAQTSGSPAAAGPPRRGGHFGFHSSTSTNFNIVANFYEGYYLSGQHVYDRLLTSRLDKRRYVLEAAASLEQPDPQTVIFKLRPGMTYHNLPPVNGRAVKADDIVATQNYVRNLPNAENKSFQTTSLDHVEAPDDQTVIYKLKAPNAYLFAASQLGNGTAQPIIPKELLDNLDTNKPVGSGPYYLADFQMNTRYLYKRFDQFRDAGKGLPYIDERQMNVMVDPVALESAFRSEQIHVWERPPVSAFERVSQEMGNKIVAHEVPGLQIWAWDLNMERMPWKDQRVREALYRLTNPKQVVQLVFDGKAAVPPGPIQAGLTAWQLDPKDTAPYFKYDVAEAKKLLSGAGYDTSKEYEIICSASSPLNEQAAQVWQQQLAQGGVKVRVVSLPFAEWLPKRIAPGDYDIILGGQPAEDSPRRAIRLHHSDQKDQFSHMGLHDPTIDAMIEKSETAASAEENIKLVKDVQIEILKRYGGNYMLITPDNLVLRNAKVQGYEINPATSPMYRTEMWLSG